MEATKTPGTLITRFAPRVRGENRINVGPEERLASVIGGGLLTLYGLWNPTPSRIAAAVAGGVLLYRGATGHCPVNEAVGRDTAHQATEPIQLKATVTVNRPRDEVYAFWRRLENLPRFMQHLEKVTRMGDGTSLWIARIPKHLGELRWEAEVVEEREGESLAWRSLPGATVDNAGTVLFADAPGGKGTEVRATIMYRPPAGAVGAAFGKLLNPASETLVQEDLRRFKHIMEAGEVPTTEGQPSGRV